MKTIAVAVTALLPLLLLASCKKDSDSNDSKENPPAADGGTPGEDAAGGADGDGGTVQSVQPGTVAISGQIDSQNGKVDKVVALPASGGNLQSGHSEGTSETPVNATGTFTVAINTTAMGLNEDGNSEALLLMIDESAAEPLDRVVGFIGMGVGDDDNRESLLRLPIGALKADAAELDLGVVTQGAAGSDATGPSSLAKNAEKFDLSQSVLEETAKVDSIVRHAKNLYANTTKEGIYWQANPFYVIRGVAVSALSAFSDPAALTNGGFGVGFGTNDTRSNFAKMCKPASDPEHLSVEVTPPDTVAQDSIVYSPTAPMTNAAVTGPEPASGYEQCGGELFYASNSGNQTTGIGGFNFGGGGFTTAMPDGTWSLKLGGEKVAAFDLAAASPFDSDGKPKVYIPSIRIYKGTNNKITKVELKWFLYDRTTSAFVQLTDLSAFKRSLEEQVTLAMTDYSGKDGNTQRMEAFVSAGEPDANGMFTFDTSTMQMHTGTTFTEGFLAPDSASTAEYFAESISVGYSMAGIRFMIDFR